VHPLEHAIRTRLHGQVEMVAQRGNGIDGVVMTVSRGEQGPLVKRASEHLRDIGARALGIGLLSGGYGQDELEKAGAYRVYQDPADLLRHLDEVGARTNE